MKSLILRFHTLLLICLLTLVPGVKADWVNYTGAQLSSTIAEVFIEDDHVTLQLEIGARDVKVFQDLLPEGDDASEQAKVVSVAQRHKRFFQSGFVLAFADGVPLTGDIKLIEKRTRATRQPQPRDASVTYVEIVYPLPGKPERLLITPPFKANGRPASIIGLMVYHKSIPVIDFSYLSSQAILILDWQDPWYSKFSKPNLKRHHRSSLMWFLYIEPYEVRHEILVRLKDLEPWMDSGWQPDQSIDIDKQASVKENVARLFKAHSRLRINGELAKPIVDRVQFVTVTRQGIQFLEKPERLAYPSAMVGVIIAYITDGMPQAVTVDWDMFNATIPKVSAMVIDPAGQRSYDMSPDHHVMTWKNYLEDFQAPSIAAIAVRESFAAVKVPVVSLLALVGILFLTMQIRKQYAQGKPVTPLVLLGSILLAGGILFYPYARMAIHNPLSGRYSFAAQEANLILTGLLRNTYRAFDFRDEEDIYDKLAVSVTGNLISDIYLQNRKRLEIENQGGARTRVKDVEILEVSEALLPDQDARSFSFRCKWLVSGSVGHWGHTHNRRNLYEAMVSIRPVAQAWKIAALELLDEQRMSTPR